MGSSSLFKFTMGEVGAKNNIRVAQWKHLMAYLKITSVESLYLRVDGKCLSCNKFDHYAKECPNGRDTSLHDDNNHSRDIFSDWRNDR